LQNAANDFVGVVTSSAANTSLVDVNSLTLGSSAATSSLTTLANATSLGATTAGALNITANGPITQTGALTITGNTVLRSTGAAAVDLSNAANVFTGALGMTLGSGTAKVVSSKGLLLSASDYGTAAVSLTAGAADRAGQVIKGGMGTDADSTTASSTASFTQSGVLKSAVGGSLVLASPTEGDVLLNSQTNTLLGTVTTTAQAANPLANFQIKSSQVNFGKGGVTARSVVLIADKVSTPEGVNGSIRLVKRGDNAVVLSFKGLTGIGSFGDSLSGKGIYVDTNDYVAVMPNRETSAASVVYLEGTRDYKPAYEFASDPTYRSIVYNGEAADSPQIRGALSSAIAPLRDTIKEQLSAGFSKENLRKQLAEGTVLQTGVARPGIDKIDSATEALACPIDANNLACAAK
jgi:hypothetical protein